MDLTFAPTAAAEATTVDPHSIRVTWTIENFLRLNVKKLCSEVFTAGGCKWRLILFPKGNYVNHLSVYLDAADFATLPCGWSRYAQFSFAVINQINNELTVRKARRYQFSARERDWGCTSFMPLSELSDPGRGYLVYNTCVFEVDVAVLSRVDDYWHDSEKETSYVRLKSPGANCYMNPLLPEKLYRIIPYFEQEIRGYFRRCYRLMNSFASESQCLKGRRINQAKVKLYLMSSE